MLRGVTVPSVACVVKSPNQQADGPREEICNARPKCPSWFIGRIEYLAFRSPQRSCTHKWHCTGGGRLRETGWHGLRTSFMRKSFSRLKASFGSAAQNGHPAGSDQQPVESHHPACPPKPDPAATNDRARSEKQSKAASESAAQPTVRCGRLGDRPRSPVALSCFGAPDARGRTYRSAYSRGRPCQSAVPAHVRLPCHADGSRGRSGRPSR